MCTSLNQFENSPEDFNIFQQYQIWNAPFVKSISFQHSPIAAQLDEKAEPSEEKDSKIYIKVFPSRSKGGDVKKEGQIWSLHVFAYTVQ